MNNPDSSHKPTTPDNTPDDWSYVPSLGTTTEATETPPPEDPEHTDDDQRGVEGIRRFSFDEEDGMGDDESFLKDFFGKGKK